MEEYYAIRVVSGDFVYLLGLHLGNLTKESQVDYFKDYSPTLSKAIIFKNLQQASSIAAGLNTSQNSESFEVIEVNPEEVDHRVRYHW